MTATFGEINGQLTLKVGGQEVSLGDVRIPVTGFVDRGSLRLTASLSEVRNLVQELFNQAGPGDAKEDK